MKSFIREGRSIDRFQQGELIAFANSILQSYKDGGDHGSEGGKGGSQMDMNENTL
jgi:hypothetical protein